MTLPKSLKIVEVSPRDGLQNEKDFIPTDLKINLIDALAKSGLQQIETTSYVSPKWVPQLKDHRDITQALRDNPDVNWVVLTPNRFGLTQALADSAKHIAVFTASSETFSKKNTNQTISDSLHEIEQMITEAKAASVTIRGYISCVMGCPYEGDVPIQKTAKLAHTLNQLGCDEISLGDTIGTGTPIKTKKLLEAVCKDVPTAKIAVHFHDTFGQALTNIYSALEEGIGIVDSSVAGLGGCPYAPGAGGNVATEDVLFLCQGLGINTGVNLEAVTHAGKLITDFLDITPRSKAAIATQAANYPLKFCR